MACVLISSVCGHYCGPFSCTSLHFLNGYTVPVQTHTIIIWHFADNVITGVVTSPKGAIVSSNIDWGRSGIVSSVLHITFYSIVAALQKGSLHI